MSLTLEQALENLGRVAGLNCPNLTVADGMSIAVMADAFSTVEEHSARVRAVLMPEDLFAQLSAGDHRQLAFDGLIGEEKARLWSASIYCPPLPERAVYLFSRHKAGTGEMPTWGKIRFRGGSERG